VATLDEWLSLNQNSGSGLSEAGTQHWVSGLGTNVTGFTALPGGSNYGGTCSLMGTEGWWWTSTPAETGLNCCKIYEYRFENTTSFSIYNTEDYGYSVRCVKNAP
jgi:uncharacterized protein (TIGR02145 family)